LLENVAAKNNTNQNKTKVEMDIRNGMGLVPVSHTCNPSYSGSRDQEDHSSKPAWANSPEDPILKKKVKTIIRKGWWTGSSGKSTCLKSVRP
jgi:hypothetical protein